LMEAKHGEVTEPEAFALVDDNMRAPVISRAALDKLEAHVDGHIKTYRLLLTMRMNPDMMTTHADGKGGTVYHDEPTGMERTVPPDASEIDEFRILHPFLMETSRMLSDNRRLNNILRAIGIEGVKEDDARTLLEKSTSALRLKHADFG